MLKEKNENKKNKNNIDSRKKKKQLININNNEEFIEYIDKEFNYIFKLLKEIKSGKTKKDISMKISFLIDIMKQRKNKDSFADRDYNYIDEKIREFIAELKKINIKNRAIDGIDKQIINFNNSLKNIIYRNKKIDMDNDSIERYKKEYEISPEYKKEFESLNSDDIRKHLKKNLSFIDRIKLWINDVLNN